MAACMVILFIRSPPISTGFDVVCSSTWPHSRSPRSPHLPSIPWPCSAELHHGSVSIPGPFSPHRDLIVSDPSPFTTSQKRLCSATM
ncbi:hypothetical protein F5Y00DRAFT_89434 [Daldinia vernicosa]|uniref:uncharacterized protein n=1 Tax=Daldinia vernicosa TaxID=114800 RepID=UPI002008084A|nr:uncharacterized protein F5Y00DRAFT_89434 [Daldinia vernicosa]KAI0848291.1 hypothetical protein F5Y00DRAFT_89434 [Daldinia vernicosa]